VGPRPDRGGRTRPGSATRSLRRTAFAEPSLTAAVTGHLTDAQWRGHIAARLAAAADVQAHRATTAVAQWSASVGILDPHVMTLIRHQRRLRRVALLSNATDRLETDLTALGVLDQVDGVYNSSTLGLAKPDPAVFTAVCSDLGSPPEDCAFLDDAPGPRPGSPRSRPPRSPLHHRHPGTAVPALPGTGRA